MPVYMKVEVGGIQNFIGGTGKLKEMIGGSEIIHHICQEDFYKGILDAIGCANKIDAPAEGGAWHMMLQNNAGTLCMLLPDKEKAAGFLTIYSGTILKKFPGLPLFGASAFMPDWSKASLDAARMAAEEGVRAQRSSRPADAGMPMLPIFRGARLDGLTAVAEAREGANGEPEPISLPSLCRRNPKMLDMSENRLRNLVKVPDVNNDDLIWAKDLDIMLGESGGKVALIHMDGNDLGKLFRDRLIKAGDANDILPCINAMRQLSHLIQEVNEKAFSHAAEYILQSLLQEQNPRDFVVPMRPLVMGGDDITLIARADIALPFIQLFTSRFSELGAAENLSLGIGMVVMDSSYPFARAFTLVESLLENAKHATLDMAPRPSSLDYLVITEEVENNAGDLRRRVYTAADGSILTGKPFILENDNLAKFISNGVKVLDELPRSAMRNAWTECRKGQKASSSFWLNTRENLARGLGGRGGRLMSGKEFDDIFPDGFFQKENGQLRTSLGDYLELQRLLPDNKGLRELFKTNAG